ncbi:MAG: hypothetical protein GQ544_02690 [Candidatus Aminicenantes bacterium]|nr:hypothetical protein [Candidatus Aminicenantes bacterium]
MTNFSMKRKTFFLIFILTTIFLIKATQETVLESIYAPGMIKVNGEEMIVVEGATIYIYSLPDLQQKMSFGQKGEGPGEMMSYPFFFNTVVALPNEYFVDSQEKVLYFSKDGTFISEKKKPIGVSNMTPVGEYFVGSKLSVIEDKIQYQAVVLYDDKFEIVKELVREVSPAQSVKMTTELPPDALNFVVHKENIFVEKSREGFLIEVYNSAGELIREIRREIKGKSIGGKEKKTLLEYFKKDRSVKAAGFDNIIRQTKLIYPDSLPVITGLEIADDKLYVKTSQRYAAQSEFLVLDLEGNELGHFQVSGLAETPLVAHLLNVRYYTISLGKIYYLTFGEEETKLIVKSINIETGF